MPIHADRMRRLARRAALYRGRDEAFARWAAGYGVIRHDDRTQVRVYEMADLLTCAGAAGSRDDLLARLHAADRVASAAMWLVVHLTYARNVYLDGRDLPESVLQRPQPWHRRLMGRALRALCRRLLLADLLDTQCGFKCFSRQAARAAFARQRTEGFAFDCEVLALARLLGYRIREVGVLWRNDPQSRVRPLRDGLRTLASLLAIRRRLQARPRVGSDTCTRQESSRDEE